jgi:hypothetical protein
VVIFAFGDDRRLLWFGGTNLETRAADPAAALTLKADALTAIARNDATSHAEILETLKALPDARVMLDSDDLRRLNR